MTSQITYHASRARIDDLRQATELRRAEEVDLRSDGSPPAQAPPGAGRAARTTTGSGQPRPVHRDTRLPAMSSR